MKRFLESAYYTRRKNTPMLHGVCKETQFFIGVTDTGLFLPNNLIVTDKLH